MADLRAVLDVEGVEPGADLRRLRDAEVRVDAEALSGRAVARSGARLPLLAGGGALALAGAAPASG